MGDVLADDIQGWGDAVLSAPATENEILACEGSLGVRLPDHLRLLLAESNGIEGEYGLGLLWPTARIAGDNLRFRDDPAFRELYRPFAGLVFFADAGNGDQFAVSLSGNQEVYVWNHVDDSRTRVAPTATRYLEIWMTGSLQI